METLQLGEFKAHFSEVIEKIKKGEEIGISFGTKEEMIAVIVPYKKYTEKPVRKLGILENKASFKIKKGFKLSDDEFLNS